MCVVQSSSPSRSNPATKLFHAIVLFGVALTGGACSDDSETLRVRLTKLSRLGSCDAATPVDGSVGICSSLGG